MILFSILISWFFTESTNTIAEAIEDDLRDRIRQLESQVFGKQKVINELVAAREKPPKNLTHYRFTYTVDVDVLAENHHKALWMADEFMSGEDPFPCESCFPSSTTLIDSVERKHDNGSNPN